MYKNIRNHVKTFHHEVSNYILKNYDIILYPDFKISKMTINEKKDFYDV
jgi:hypothetical protein